MKRYIHLHLTLALIAFNVDVGFAQASQPGLHLTTGVFHSMVSDYPFSPYLLKGAAPLFKVGASWGSNRFQDVMANVAHPKLRPTEVEQDYASSWFATLHYGFLPSVVSSQRWHAWAGPSITARGSYRELEDVSGELMISLDAKMRLQVPINTKTHLTGSLFFPVVSFIDYQSYALGNEEMDWASFSKLQSVTTEISYSRLISQRLSLICAYEFMIYQYTLAEKKKVLTQQFQLGLTWHLKTNEN